MGYLINLCLQHRKNTVRFTTLTLKAQEWRLPALKKSSVTPTGRKKKSNIANISTKNDLWMSVQSLLDFISRSHESIDS